MFLILTNRINSALQQRRDKSQAGRSVRQGGDTTAAAVTTVAVEAAAAATAVVLAVGGRFNLSTARAQTGRG